MRNGADAAAGQESGPSQGTQGTRETMDAVAIRAAAPVVAAGDGQGG